MFNMAKNQKSYTPEFKQQIVDLYNAGGTSYPQLEREYGVNRSTLSNWVKQFSPIKVSDDKTITLKFIHVEDFAIPVFWAILLIGKLSIIPRNNSFHSPTESLKLLVIAPVDELNVLPQSLHLNLCLPHAFSYFFDLYCRNVHMAVLYLMVFSLLLSLALVVLH